MLIIFCRSWYFTRFMLWRSFDQCAHNPHSLAGRPFLVYDCIVTCFKCFEFVNSLFITTENNFLHFQQLGHHAAKSTITQSSVFDMDNTREWEWGQKTGVVTQPRLPFSSSVALYYWCEWKIWGRIVGESSGTHSIKHRHCQCWWSSLYAPFLAALQPSRMHAEHMPSKV